MLDTVESKYSKENRTGVQPTRRSIANMIKFSLEPVNLFGLLSKQGEGFAGCTRREAPGDSPR